MALACVPGTLAPASQANEEQRMGSTIGEIVPLGLGVAVSPVPVVAVILMLLTSRARSNAPALLAGGIVALAVIVAGVLLISSRTAMPDLDTQSTAASSATALVGVLLLLLAWRQWRNRPKQGEEPGMPGWMRQMERMNPALALGFGVFGLGVNPKDTPLAALAAVEIEQAGLSAGQSAVILAIFIAIATASVAAPIVLYFALGQRAEATLHGWRTWLTAHNAAVMAVLFLAFGVWLVARGAQGLTS